MEIKPYFRGTLMPFLPEVIIPLLAVFEVCFTKPTWEHSRTLLIGAILCTGKRTVTSCLHVMGLSNEGHFDRYHRVLNRAKWSELQASKILLGLLILLLPKGFPIIILMDETYYMLVFIELKNLIYSRVRCFDFEKWKNRL